MKGVSSSAPADPKGEGNFVPYSRWPASDPDTDHPGYARDQYGWTKVPVKPDIPKKKKKDPLDDDDDDLNSPFNSSHSKMRSSFPLNLKAPIFNNTVEEWSQFQHKCNLYRAQMEVNGQTRIAGLNVLGSLTGISWQLCDDLTDDPKTLVASGLSLIHI